MAEEAVLAGEVGLCTWLFSHSPQGL
jgi:hypothetical protein